MEAGLQKWGQHIRNDDGQISMSITSEADLPTINRYLTEKGVDIFAFNPQKVSLEDLFLQVVENDDN